MLDVFCDCILLWSSSSGDSSDGKGVHFDSKEIRWPRLARGQFTFFFLRLRSHHSDVEQMKLFTYVVSACARVNQMFSGDSIMNRGRTNQTRFNVATPGCTR